MIEMILKMSAATAIYVLLTFFLWKQYGKKEHTPVFKCMVGVLYGVCSILSTHFGVEYSHMVLNVRDVGPLAAGLFFDPVSGIIAGLIGGIERYIAGTYWGIGSYTVLACSISTVLAGILAAFLRSYLFRKSLPRVLSAFIVGAVMEVFHMYAVFFTHPYDISTAFYVVKNCAVPMILFSGLSLGIFAALAHAAENEEYHLFKKKNLAKVPLSQTFQNRLIIITLVILVASFFFSFVVQTRTARQNAIDLLSKTSASIKTSYEHVSEMQQSLVDMSMESAISSAEMIANAMEGANLSKYVETNILENMRDALGLISINILDKDKNLLVSTGDDTLYLSWFKDIDYGLKESVVVQVSDTKSVAVSRCGNGFVQVAVSTEQIAKDLRFTGLNEVLSNYSVGTDGSYDIVRETGTIVIGDHFLKILGKNDIDNLKAQPEDRVFEASYFGEPCICWKRTLNDGTLLLTMLPFTEVYASRDSQAYETALADILLFAVIYAAIFMLVQYLIVRNLKKTNQSLGRITEGHLDEVVDVRSSSEFNTLSDDINKTVDALKGYISAAEKRMEQELETAHVIQESALPKNFHFPRSDFKLFAIMDPAKEVGGDFYDFFFIDNDKIALVIADVSGKGIPAALFMMRSKTIIQNLALTGVSPADIFEKANEMLCDSNDAEMFVSVWIGIIDLDTGHMQCANAGHEYPVIMRQNGEYELFKDPHGLVLAAMDGIKIKEYELQLHPGDKIFVYTDGVPEAINEDTEQYGLERLVHVLNEVKEKEPEDTLPAVLEDIYRFVGKSDQFDDITMLGFELTSPH